MRATWWVFASAVAASVVSCGGNNNEPAASPVCADGIDNDGDAMTDFPADVGCTDETDGSEDSAPSPQCSDGRDNDGDGKVDFPGDPGCYAPQQNDETDDCPDGPGCPQCANGVDDDGNGSTDFPADAGCSAASDPVELLENPVACGPNLVIKPLPADGSDMGVLDGTSTSNMMSPCGGGGGAPAVAYTLLLTQPKVVTVSTDDGYTTADTVIDIRSASCAMPEAEVACNDDIDGDNRASKLVRSLPPGTYYVLIEGHDATATGTYSVTIDLAAGEGAACTASDQCGPGLVCRPPNQGGGAMTCQKPMCSDAFDNDGDGKTDYPAEPGCAGGDDNDETDHCPNGADCPDCSDHADNDGDGKIDYPMDPSCHAAGDSSEACATSEAVTVLTMPATAGDTSGATDDIDPTCASSSGSGPDRLYRLDLPATTTLAIELTGLAFDSTTELLNSTCGGAALTCSDPAAMEITNLAAGTYYFVVDGWFSDEQGPYTIEVSGTVAPGGSCEGALFQSGALTCANGLACDGPAGARTCRSQCSDGVDNNGDGKIDYPRDPGCASPADNSETTVCPGAACPACADGADNDADGKIDYPQDPSCTAAGGTSESCVSGEPITVVTQPMTTGTTVGATDDYDPTCASSSGSGPDVVMQLDLPRLSSLHLDLDASYDSVHALLGASCNGTALACEDPEDMELAGVAAGTYFLVVDGYFATSEGAFALAVSGEVAPGGSCEGALFQSGALTCSNGLTCDGPAGARTCRSQCSDGVDNNGDGRVDYPNDPSCTSAADNTETTVCPGPMCPVCTNGNDDDGDALRDYPADFGCASAAGTSEVFCAGEPDVGGKIAHPVTDGTLANKAGNYAQTCQSNTGNDVAYALQLPVPVDTLTVTTNGSTIADTVLSLKDASCGGAQLACDDDSGTGFLSAFTLSGVAAGNYAIQVDGFGASNNGAFELNVRGTVAKHTACTSPLFAAGVLFCPSGTSCTGGKCE